MRGKVPGIGEGVKRAGEPELAGVEGLLQRDQEASANEPRQDAHRQEEPRATDDPLRTGLS